MAKTPTQLDVEIAKATARTFKKTIRHLASEIGGSIRYTLTETVIAKNGGVEVSVHADGMAEGERVNQRSTTFYPGVSLGKAAAYRLKNGYSEVT